MTRSRRSTLPHATVIGRFSMAKKRRRAKRSSPKPSERGAIDEFFALESAPPAPVMDELEIRAGTFPHPDELPDEALPAMLWRMVRALACMRTFILHTNHLDDRALYARLWRNDLREESFVATPRGMHGGFFLDILGSGSDEDHALYLRYHATAASRRQHAKSGEKPPRKQRPPYDRDRFLPKCGLPFDAGPRFHPNKWHAPM